MSAPSHRAGWAFKGLARRREAATKLRSREGAKKMGSRDDAESFVRGPVVRDETGAHRRYVKERPVAAWDRAASGNLRAFARTRNFATLRLRVNQNYSR
ncbi:hypothetical protein ACU5AX_12840 [Sphingomonas sp. XXL09]|uniref:hypothetical protein n=1 Tax=Sphingomonas sp. XXL09 TaxID=3457787 RepID=UPI00406BA5EC